MAWCSVKAQRQIIIIIIIIISLAAALVIVVVGNPEGKKPLEKKA
jgi:hypothetical protein